MFTLQIPKINTSNHTYGINMNKISYSTYNCLERSPNFKLSNKLFVKDKLVSMLVIITKQLTKKYITNKTLAW